MSGDGIMVIWRGLQRGLRWALLVVGGVVVVDRHLLLMRLVSGGRVVYREPFERVGRVIFCLLAARLLIGCHLVYFVL